MTNNYIFTSESVSEGHPDKLCDRISDEICDLFLAKDAKSRVAVECLATTQKLVIAGEVKTKASISSEEIIARARNAVKDIGYEQDGFHWRDMQVDCVIHNQSADIAMGVDNKDETKEGAGDQGIMFGYAVDETESLMPAPIDYAHRILKSLSDFRRNNKNSGLGPDAKSQVSLKYEDGKPVGVHSVVVSHQHSANMSQKQIRELVREHVVGVLPKGWFPIESEFYTNPTGQFIIGGPDGDCGLTGRKIIVDTYGGAAPHGGGAFSGKDPSKVDRSAAYAARYLAKNIVASGVAKRCVIQVSYAIGVAKPLSIYVNSYGTARVSDSKIADIIADIMDLSPFGIRSKLNLHRPIYVPTSAYGHFGRKCEGGFFPWEATDLADTIKHLAG